MATVSANPLFRRITSFPLERPSGWVRRREAPGPARILPYFIAGEENRLAAFVAFADHAALDIGNPLLLIGPSGAGKSSLAMHLAARLACSHRQGLESVRTTSVRAVSGNTESGSPEPGSPDSLDASSRDDSAAETIATLESSEPGAVLYFNAVDFARAYAQAVAADDLQPLRDQIQQAAVWVIDDLHLIRTNRPHRMSSPYGLIAEPNGRSAHDHHFSATPLGNPWAASPVGKPNGTRSDHSHWRSQLVKPASNYSGSFRFTTRSISMRI